MEEPILIVDDDVNLNRLLCRFIEKNGFRPVPAYSAEEALKLLSGQDFRMVLTDLRLPRKDGLELLQWISGHKPGCPTLLMTNYADVQTAVKAMKLGAFDYIAKPIVPDDLLKKITDALEASNPETIAGGNGSQSMPSTLPGLDKNSFGTSKGEGANRPIRAAAKAGKDQATEAKEASTGFIQGRSPAAQKLSSHIRLVAPTPISVLINGESGTGKEYIARLIHLNSKQAQGPFVAVDCGSIPKDLAGSELFGHKKGSFTGAVADKNGFFQQAEGGTLFFDEIENLPYSVQIHLLRALQEKKIRAIGAEKDTETHVRIIAATNENLPELCEKGRFRIDLYHRLNEFSIQATPLRERKEDIPLFVEKFLENANRELEKDPPVLGLEPEVEKIFMAYNWPGNIRELLYTVKRACLLCQGESIRTEDLPAELQAYTEGTGNPTKTGGSALSAEAPVAPFPAQGSRPGSKISLAQEEKERILECLRQVNYNKTKAAKLLNMDRKTLYNKLRSYGIE